MSSDSRITARVVLVVDDEQDFLDFFTRAMRHEYTVIRCAKADAALQILSERTIDVVVSDQMMPGMSGIAFLREAAKIQPNTLRLLVCGFAEADVLDASLGDGTIHASIWKPVDSSGLLRAVKRAEENRRVPA